MKDTFWVALWERSSVFGFWSLGHTKMIIDHSFFFLLVSLKSPNEWKCNNKSLELKT